MPINNTWQLRLDRRGRGGFISELTSQTDLVTAHNAPIEFTLNATVGEVLQLMKQSDVIMQVTYLRSYTNSGIVSAYALGQSFPRGQEMDALWPDYEEYRYTVPVTKNYRINDLGIPAQFDSDKPMKVIFMHDVLKRREDKWEALNVTAFIETQPRTGQLFKIISVVVCRS